MTTNTVAADFFDATLLTGLRPVEWAMASLETVGKQWKLQIKNAKSTNGRSHGVFRTLWFAELSFKQVTAVRNTIALFSAAHANNTLNAMQERIERRFRAANKHLWPRRTKTITPYSLRHAFAARAKTVFSSPEVAALMGHAVDRTAFQHYGRSKTVSGRWQSRPIPDQMDVDRVRSVRSASLERMRAMQLSKDARRGGQLLKK